MYKILYLVSYKPSFQVWLSSTDQACNHQEVIFYIYELQFSHL